LSLTRELNNSRFFNSPGPTIVAISKPDVSQICLPAGGSDAKDIAILENYIVCLREHRK
jgi:hypothetical protein